LSNFLWIDSSRAVSKLWVFPSTKKRKSTVFQEEISEWFDIQSLTHPDSRAELQVDGLKETIVRIRNLIDEEVNLLGGDPKRLIFGGISQGEVTALATWLGSKLNIGGFVISGWLPCAGKSGSRNAQGMFFKLKSLGQS